MKKVKLSSVKYIANYLNVTKEIAEKIKSVSTLQGDDLQKELGSYPDLVKHFSGFYHAPSRFQVKMEIFNKLIEGHGVEFVEEKTMEYVNQGDTYTPTILGNSSGYFLGCIGDLF